MKISSKQLMKTSEFVFISSKKKVLTNVCINKQLQISQSKYMVSN